MIKAADWHAVPQLHNLVGLPFAAVIHVHHFPGAFIPHRGKRIVEFERVALVSGVFQHAFYLPVLHQPTNIGCKMELLAVGANRPAFIPIQDDAAFGTAHNVVQASIRAGR